MEQKKESKIWDLPADWRPELTKSARKLYGRLMCLTSAGTRPCTFTDEQANAQLTFSAATTQRLFSELRKAARRTTKQVRNQFGNRVRQVELDGASKPSVITKNEGFKTSNKTSFMAQNHGFKPSDKALKNQK